MSKTRGRPPLPPDQRRSVTVLVSLNRSEAANLGAWARREGLRLSGFVRKALDLSGVLREAPEDGPEVH